VNRTFARVCAAAALSGIASSVFAMQPCPEGAAKPWWDDALGYVVLALAVLLGALIPYVARLKTMALPAGRHALIVLLAALVGFGIWAAGLLVWLGGFALRC